MESLESPLPTGTLTLLFSDIEGSTSLLSQLGERYAEVLSTQRSILRAAFEQWRGREMGTEGDSFFVVFTSVGDAVHAAVQAQTELRRQPWPEDVPVGVRMGLHTGEPTRHEDGYVGMDVHRAARVAASAHGGQVVLSEATYRIATAQALEGVSFVDLRWHRLKDMPEPEHLYQLAAAGLDREFPALRSLGASANLPVPATSIVGRERERQELHELLRTSGVRLVTLTGPGGSGKTRLAIAAAALLEGDFPDGVYFVPLESVESEEVMWTTIAEVLGVTGEGRAPPTFLEHLSSRSVLILLDNLEQLPAAAGVVHELLTAAPNITVLATSRRPLHLAGEYEHPVPPLTLPTAGDDDPAAAADSGAVALFVQRARMVRRGFALTAGNAGDVVEICRQLDGLPLAIELAAARVKLLSPHALKARLDRSLELTVRESGRPMRQQTLRGTIAWSYELLSPELQSFFRRLGVFSADFDLDAIAAVTANGSDPEGGDPECRGDPDGADPLDRVADLVDVSLATVADGPDGEPRVRLLQTIAAYAREQLAVAGELEAAHRRHAEHYLTFAETVAPQLRSSQYLGARDRIETELENLRAALGWSLSAGAPHGPPRPQELVTGLRLCQELSWFWYACGYHSEGRRWLERALDAAADREAPELMAALHGLAVLLLEQGDAQHSRDILRACLDFWRHRGDPRRVAVELNSLAVAHRALCEPDMAKALLAESIALAREVGDKRRLASALSNLAMIELDEQAPDSAVELLHEALAIDRELGDAWGVSVGHVNLAAAMIRAGRIPEARDYLRDHGPSAVALSDVDLTINVIELFAMIFAELGDTSPAARLLGAAGAMREKAELPITAPDAAILEKSMGKARSLPDADTWALNVRVGADYSVEDALREATA
jgi:predicted ATPase/class 3 adenylate cyclase